MKMYVTALSSLVLALTVTTTVAQTQRALLIGINTYQPEGTTAQHPAGCIYGRCELGSFENLDGAVNDAQAMADLLTSPKFGFPANQVVLLTNPAAPQPRPGVVVLPASQTDRDGILAAMQKFLVDEPKPGDTVVFYDASHGSLRVNSKGAKLTILTGGKLVHADTTLVPADAYKGGFDVRDREITRIFNAALDKGIHLTAIFDSCHSGGISRGLGPKYKDRTLAFDPRDIAEAPDTLPNGDPRQAPTERQDNPALVFSAAEQDQTAKELPPSDKAAEPHGAFTAALVQALQALPANAPASLVYQRVKAVLEGGAVPDQEPDLDANAARRAQPLFGGKAADPGKMRTAALQTDDSGSIWLDIGRVSGVGVGSEFTAASPDSKGQTVKLRVTDLQGIARSSASVISPAGAKVAAGEVFELTKWIPAEQAPLHIWLWPSNLSIQQVVAAGEIIASSGVSLVSDPAEQAWTHVLCWDGSNWTLQQAGAPAPTLLGPQLTADALKQHLPGGAKLWANLPPPKELAAKLAPGDPSSAVQTAADLKGADYALTGTLTADGPAYAWYHKSELAAGPPSSNAHDHSPGCSATSPYPVRSNWVDLTGLADLDTGVTSLNKYSSLLGKVHGWLDLANSPADASTGNYYTLTMVPVSASAQSAAAQQARPGQPDSPVREGDRLKMVLQSTDRVIERRWVYVLDINCQGKGELVYPLNYAENQFPNDADSGRQFDLPGTGALSVTKPFGVDTLILLSTAQPLPDPHALDFAGVATRGARGLDSPLEKLLANTSSGTRGFSGEVPTNWGIALTTMRSVPKEAAQ